MKIDMLNERLATAKRNYEMAMFYFKSSVEQNSNESNFENNAISQLLVLKELKEKVKNLEEMVELEMLMGGEV